MLRRWARLTVPTLAAAVVSFLVARYTAHAGPGAAKQAFSFAGTLTKDGKPYPGPVGITFTLKNGSGVTCAGVNVVGGEPVPIDPATGAFRTRLDTSSCTADLLDGSALTVDVQVAGAAVVTGQPLDPVPYAKYADAYGSPDCPVGYARTGTAAKRMSPVCKRGMDEVVKVGFGASAFWIDRYEAILVDDGGATYALTYPSTLPFNGLEPGPSYVHAESRAGVSPAAYLTWFQAARGCREAGKRLPTSEEWLLAAAGTPDPGANSGTNGVCYTATTDGVERTTGLGTACESEWGAQDMIGNLTEATSEWFTTSAAMTVSGGGVAVAWPAGACQSTTNCYSGDTAVAASGSAYGSDATAASLTTGLPSVAYRGGAMDSQDGAGVFAVTFTGSPAYHDTRTGFRCVIPR
jgi:formylglycine-generating enzyme required for sulfatase activity